MAAECFQQIIYSQLVDKIKSVLCLICCSKKYFSNARAQLLSKAIVAFTCDQMLYSSTYHEFCRLCWSHTLLSLPFVVSSCYPLILLWSNFASNCVLCFFILLSVTEKVWESASEEETPSTTTITSDKDSELSLKSRQEKPSPVKASKGAKQSSLMSFFKK